MKEYNKRFYRSWVSNTNLKGFSVQNKESDLFILADTILDKEAKTILDALRHDLETHISRNELFAVILKPVETPALCSELIKVMCSSSKIYNVGPMASVAGAFSEQIGKELLKSSRNVIVENGGDIFARSDKPLRLALYAGEDSPFSNNVLFEVDAKNGIGVCTSSASVGPSFSFGHADAVVAVSDSTALADAAATAIANRIKSPDDVEKVINQEAEKNVLKGLIACCGDKIAFWGEIKII